MSFSKRIEAALQEPDLTENIQNAMAFLRRKRIDSIESETDWLSAQDFGDKVRDYSTRNLGLLLEQLEEKCIANGFIVHWAENSSEARDIILSIAQEANAKSVVKGKSMASEEIELNEHLEKHGIKAVESDMGEYIVQLAGERPSHIIMPAIHKTKHDIAALFEHELRESADPEDVDGLIGIGRKVLRKHFKDADIGVSGVNFAIAETGTICLVENEGNGRLSTTAPNTHIALMGIEKVIPTLEDLPTLLYLLTRSATGQKITTYLNLINGPRKPNEKDGPQFVHLVLLDNGRTKISKDSDFRATLKCIRCGACMNHCPVYSRIGGHAYGTTYPGPIGQAFTPQQPEGEIHSDLVAACSLNAACAEACPVNVPLPKLIRKLRSSEHNLKKASLVEKIAWSIWGALHSNPKWFRLATRIARLPGTSKLYIPRKWLTARKYPSPAGKTLHELMAERKGPDHG